MKKSIIVGAAMLSVAGIAQAAQISWGSSFLAYDAADETGWVSQAGTLVSAINSSSSTNAIVNYAGIDWANAGNAAMTNGVAQNGVTITAGGANLALHEGFGAGLFTDTENFYNGGNYNFASLTLAGLDDGQEYQLQIMGNDARGGGTFEDSRWTTLGDGTQSVADSVAAGTEGAVILRTDPQGSAGYVIGTFFGDATGIQTIDIFGSRGASDSIGSLSTSQFNALQLRAVPEPATFGLLAVFGGGMLFARRRFKR